MFDGIERMMKYIILVSIFFGCFFKAEGRSLKFVNKSHNFGDVMRGEILSWQVEFTNTGKSDVRIQGVYSGCGCAAIELLPDTIYRPNQKGSILVKFDTSNFIGRVSKQIIVISSEKIRAQTFLTVKANIKEEFRITPVLIDFGVVSVDGQHARSFTIAPVGTYKLDVKDIEFNKDRFRLNWSEKDGLWSAKLSLKEGVSSGFIKDTLYVRTNSDFLPKVKIPVRVEVKNLIDLYPSYLEFGVLAKGKSRAKKIVLESDKHFSLNPLKHKLWINNQIYNNTAGLISVEVASKAKKKHKINVTMKNSSEFGGSVHGKLLFESSFESHKQLVIDFYAFFK